ncbi:hypothetical protein D3C76_994360 [compost metagenome]|jgi:hypothetical protein|uniref:hypothetical protein n=1 Tax=Pseudomonas putida TaxID=303 RepID=UPI000FC27155|nr:hypothetical protein [Pseudomonas putida]WPJ98556.1 hypothetical protein R6U79_15040 [Pseudomonas putida]
MIKLKPLLPIMAALTMAGCMTAERMPDGKTRIRFSDETANSLASLIPAGVVPGSAAASGGELDLMPKKSPAGSGLYLYFNGRYDFACASALLYSAKSGRPLDESANVVCRDRYYQRQLALKQAGNPYDRAAPPYNAHNPNNEYWEKLKGQTLGQLRTTQRFATRLSAITRIERDGNHTISLGFAGDGDGVHVALVPQPIRIPVLMENADEQAKLRMLAANATTQIGEWVTCNVLLDYDRTLDRGPRPRHITSQEYRQYEVLFNVASVSCKRGIH